MANTLDVDQIYPVVNSIVGQATGKTDIQATDASSFVTVADIALKCDPDVLLGAISQVLSKTINSVRPYERKFKGLEKNNIRFGNHVRKLSIVDKDFEKDQRYDLTDGQSIDMFKVNKPDVIQMNFYGQQIFSRRYTIWKDQTDIAFSSPAEFASFITMIVTNCSDLIEQAHESLARALVANAIGATVELNNTRQVVKLLTEYNNLTGLSLSPSDVYKPDNYKAFVEFCYAVMATVSEQLTDRTQIYHNNITGKPVSRHSPKSMQKAYIHTPIKNKMDAMAVSNVFNDKYLKGIDAEMVNFWQSSETPDSINMKVGYTDASGSPDSADIEQDNVYGILFDEECLGVTTINQWSANSPFNIDGGYTNTAFHFTDRHYYDNSENHVVFLME